MPDCARLELGYCSRGLELGARVLPGTAAPTAGRSLESSSRSWVPAEAPDSEGMLARAGCTGRMWSWRAGVPWGAFCGSWGDHLVVRVALWVFSSSGLGLGAGDLPCPSRRPGGVRVCAYKAGGREGGRPGKREPGSGGNGAVRRAAQTMMRAAPGPRTASRLSPRAHPCHAFTKLQRGAPALPPHPRPHPRPRSLFPISALQKRRP